MSSEVTLGGERLGGGKKMKVHLHNYERSTHNLSHVLRTTMSPGTLVPFLKQVALPGDTFDIELNADVMTSPTIGPLFGSFQLQYDVFVAPIRLYQAMLHMNMLLFHPLYLYRTVYHLLLFLPFLHSPVF